MTPDPSTIFSYLGWGVFGISGFVVFLFSAALAYHWLAYEKGNPVIYLGGVVYIIGAAFLLLNLLRATSVLLLS